MGERCCRGRNRIRKQTTQRILSAETIASEPFQNWLREQNQSGADIFIWHESRTGRIA